MYEDYDIYIWLLVLLLATLMDEGSTPSISTKNYIQLDIIRSISNELYSNRYNGDELEFDKEIRVKGRSTQLTGEQVELAMAAW